LFWLMKRIVAILSNRKLQYSGCRKVLNHVLILKYCFIHWKDNKWSTVTLSLEIVGEGLVLLTGLDWCLFLLGHSLVELCTWVTSGWWNTCVCFHGLIIKKKKNCPSLANNHCRRWQSLAPAPYITFFAPSRGLSRTISVYHRAWYFVWKFLEEWLHFCAYLYKSMKHVQVRSCLLVLSGFTMFRYKALFATQCLNLLLHSWVQYLFCLGIWKCKVKIELHDHIIVS
jgi:hypothetical protein